MPRITAILETVLYVGDLDRAEAFYRDVMGLSGGFGDARMRSFDVAGTGMLLLFRRGDTLAPITMPGGVIPPHDGAGPSHIAFAIAEAELTAWRDHLVDCDVAIESSVDWPRGGHSVYFRDPDLHLLELATPGLWPGY